MLKSTISKLLSQKIKGEAARSQLLMYNQEQQIPL